MTISQHIYTSSGTQRPVYTSGCTIGFDLSGAPAGSVVEWTDEPLAEGIERHQQRLTFNPLSQLAGIITGATAIRVRVAAGVGYCVLTVEDIDSDPDAALIGALTKFNSQLEAVNRDMRVAAGLV